MSLSAKIFLGLGLGIATGIFLGEITAPLKGVGAAYVQLLQMAVLPYIMITLMSGIGKLKYGEAVRLSLRVCSLLVLIWALTFAVLYIFPLSFPNLQSASFFSSTMIEPPQRFNFLEFIPSNPFYSMASPSHSGLTIKIRPSASITMPHKSFSQRAPPSWSLCQLRESPRRRQQQTIVSQTSEIVQCQEAVVSPAAQCLLGQHSGVNRRNAGGAEQLHGIHQQRQFGSSATCRSRKKC